MSTKLYIYVFTTEQYQHLRRNPAIYLIKETIIYSYITMSESTTYYLRIKLLFICFVIFYFKYLNRESRCQTLYLRIVVSITISTYSRRMV